MQTVAVIGSGTMGAGIAQLAATSGCNVHLIDVNAEALAKAQADIAARIRRMAEKGTISPDEAKAAIGRIRTDSRIRDLENVDLAIEAVVEDLGIKQKVFASIEQSAPSTAVLASNTSSISISRIAECVASPERLVGMHFFNPAPLMPLVEVIAGRKSSPAAVDKAYRAAADWGKVPVRAKDTPGFIVNRVARGFYLEALRLLGEGVAGVDEIDAIIRNRGSFRMGPFELMDLVGLDVNLAVSTSVWGQMDEHPRFTPHPIQQKLVSQGHLGQKTGRGFYAYKKDHKVPAVTVDRRSFDLNPLMVDASAAFCHGAGVADASRTEQYIFARILGAIINEAGHAFSEKVATSDDIDLAMTKGTNYPKGPLAWADEIGHRTVRGTLKTLNESTGDDRYAPAELFARAS